MSGIIDICVTAVNQAGRAFCEYAAGIFVQIAVLVAVLLCIDWLSRKRIRATLLYWIWMLVFVKLLLPPSLCVPTGIGYWLGRGEALPAPSVVPQIVEVAKLPAPTSVELPIATPVVRSAESVPTVVRPSDSIAESRASLTWQGGVLLAWIAGVLVFAGLVVQRWRFVKELIARSEPAPEDLAFVLDGCRRRMGVRRKVDVRLLPEALSPAVCGLLHPTILVPRELLNRLSPEGIRTVLIHELAHVRRGDLWANSLQTALQVVYFYNPLVWLANAIVRRVREQAVDEMVLVALGAEARSYGNTLIDIAEMAFLRPSPALRLIGVAESRKSLEGRIKHMMTRPIPKSAKVGIAGVLIIAAMGAILLPMAAAGTQTAKQSPFTATLPNGAAGPDDQEQAARAKSAETLGELGRAALFYTITHEGRLPDRIEDLPDESGVVKSWLAQNVMYLGKHMRTYSEPDTPVAYDRTLLQAGQGTNVLYLDTRVVFEGPERLKGLGIIGVPPESRTQLEELGQALLIYASQHVHQYPDTLQDARKYISERGDFSWMLANVEYLGKGGTPREQPGRILAFDKTLLTKGNGTNVLYRDAHVAFQNPRKLDAIAIVAADSGAARQDNEGGAFRSYEINRSVADFPAGEDFSTPEAAYATINRMDRDDPSAWRRVSIARSANRFAADSEHVRIVDPEWTKIMHSARIREVLVWNLTRAAVIAELSLESSGKTIVEPFDVRYLEVEQGRWLNTGNDRFASIEAAKTKFRNWIQRETAQAEAMRDPLAHAGEIQAAAVQLFDRLRAADYAKILSYYHDGKWDNDGWKQFPTLDLYTVATDYPSFALWCATHFKDNPIVSVHLGDVFLSDALIADKTGRPTVPYKVTLKDGSVLAGNLPFYLSQGKWIGLEGIDWHLWPNGTK